jgi:hypothetical protein
VAVTAAVMDDGLGAFRASTSFNDFTTLELPAATAVGANAPIAPTDLDPKKVEQPKASKKRSGGSHLDVPAPKKKSNARKVSVGSMTSLKIKSKAGPSAKVNASLAVKIEAGQNTKAGGNNTPNPLSCGSAPASAHASVVKAVTIKATAVPAPSPAPAVISPRFPNKVIVAPVALTALTVVDPPALAGTATEADFKSVAQAAVSSLIASKPESSSSSQSAIALKVDTSTEHIKALTGTNWVAVCAGVDESQCDADSTCDKTNNRARRQNLTPDERARQNRDRNREHARNTRLRKKAYVEELKRTLTELVSQRDAAELEKRHSAQRELEQREVRFRVIEEFLKLRGRNEVNFARWSAILEDNFSLSLPVTDFRKMIHSNNNSCQRSVEQVLTGVSEAMSDSTSLASFLQTLGNDPNATSDVSLAYYCDRKRFFMDNCNAVLDWTATSVGAVEQVRISKTRVEYSPN